MSYALPISIFASIEPKFGTQGAIKISQTIEESVRSEQKKAESKRTIEKELNIQLMSKQDCANLKADIETRITQIQSIADSRVALIEAKFSKAEAKTTGHFYVIIAVVVILNIRIINELAKLLEIAK